MFKTIQECRLDLIAYSVGRGWPVANVDFIVDDLGEQETLHNLDYFPCSAARVSFGKEDKTGEDETKDDKLMKYLADHDHTSPFEHQSATFLVEVPLFIRSQIMRHRTFSYNEISRRYTDENIEFWLPDSWRKQSDNNRQASTNEEIESAYEMSREYSESIHRSLSTYNLFLELGLSRELARSVLPQSLLTKFYMSGTLLNWSKFIKLRKHEGAQYEVVVVANRIEDHLRILWPNAAGVLLDADE